MRRRLPGALLALLLGTAASAPAGPAAAGDCARGTFEGTPFTACEVDPAAEDLRLFLADDDGAVWGGFSRLDGALRQGGARLGVAMNGGMYHPDRRPVGLHVEGGREVSGLVTRAGPGNFGLLPNGVFCWGDGAARVIETLAFAAEAPDCRFATQSGPMLVIDGRLHPRFLPSSDSRFIRNGVGVRPDGAVVLAISDAPITFHAFARLFRDALGTPDALYIDGKVSRLWAPGIGRTDGFGLPLGPILGTVVPAD